MQAPSSPAASLLGIASSEILKPTDPKAFKISLQSATNNFTTIPNSFAVDIAPAWFFGGKNIDAEKATSNAFKDNVWQSLVISAAFKRDTINMANLSQLGLGMKISLIRGNISRNYKASLKKAHNNLKDLRLATETTKRNKKISSLKQEMRKLAQKGKQNSNEYTKLRDEAEHLQSLENEDTLKKLKVNHKPIVEELKTIAKNTKFTHYGFKLLQLGLNK